MNNKRIKDIILLAALPALLIACSSDRDEAPEPGPREALEEDVITFRVSSGNATETRASLVEFYDDMTEREIAVTSILEDGATYFENNKLICTNSQWNTTVKNYWPAEGRKLDFYAHQPYDDANISNNTLQSFDYIIPKDNSGQYDLMYAITKDKRKADEVDLNFKHALAAITFEGKTKESGLVVVVSGIDICNVLSKGTFSSPSSTEIKVDDENNVIDNGQAGTWSNIGVPADGNVILSAGITETTLTTDPMTLTSASGTLMLIPQTLIPWDYGTEDDPKPTTATTNGRECYLRIHCSLLSNGLYLAGAEGKADGIVYVPFGGTFEAGKHYTYTLVFGLGYTADGLTNRIKVSLEATITDWNRENISFDKYIL